MGKKIEITSDIRQAVEDTWQAIGSDAYAAAQEGGEDISNAIAIELVIDAGRMRHFGHEPAADEINELIRVHGYSAVLDALAEEIRLA